MPLIAVITLCMGGWYSWMNELIYIWMTWSIYEWADWSISMMLLHMLAVMLDCWRFGKGLCCEVLRTLHPVKKRSNEKWWDEMSRSMIDRSITLRTAEDDDLLVVFIDELSIRWGYFDPSRKCTYEYRRKYLNCDPSFSRLYIVDCNQQVKPHLSWYDAYLSSFSHHILLSCIYCKKVTLYFDFGS